VSRFQVCRAQLVVHYSSKASPLEHENRWNPGETDFSLQNSGPEMFRWTKGALSLVGLRASKRASQGDSMKARYDCRETDRYRDVELESNRRTIAVLTSRLVPNQARE
jgi:hypothetical protein